MSPGNIVCELHALASRVDGRDKEVIEHAIGLLEQYGDQLKGLKWMASRRFRASSEKIEPGQLTMAFLAHLLEEAQKRKLDGAQPSQKVPRKKRKSKIHALPVTVQNREIAAAERVCPCGACKEPMGFDTRRQIVYEPARLFMLEERLHKYACKACKNGVVMANGTPKPIDGGLASASLLAHVVVTKVVDCVPVERIGKQLERHDCDIASSTLYDWFAQAAQAIVPLQEHIKRELLASRLVSLDDTPLPAKNANVEKNIQRGRLWLYVGDVDRIAFCQFSEDWKGKHPRGILADFDGDIQSDGYGGINSLFCGSSPPTRFGCNDHARRRFYEAMKLGDTRANDIVELYGQLYAVERRTAGQSPEHRLHERRELSVPIWDELTGRIDALGSGIAAKGPLGKAITYWRKQGPTLRAFLTNGHVPISNAHVERLLRTVALLRKNALFVGSLEAGDRYAALLTLALNCALCGANPSRYFTWLFDRLNDLKARDALTVMPQAWLRSQEIGKDTFPDGDVVAHDAGVQELSVAS